MPIATINCGTVSAMAGSNAKLPDEVDAVVRRSRPIRRRNEIDSTYRVPTGMQLRRQGLIVLFI